MIIVSWRHTTLIGHGIYDEMVDPIYPKCPMQCVCVTLLARGLLDIQRACMRNDSDDEESEGSAKIMGCQQSGY